MVEMRPSGTFTPEILKPPLRQVLAGLDYLHRFDIIHTGMAVSFATSKRMLGLELADQTNKTSKRKTCFLGSTTQKSSQFSKKPR